MTPLKRPAGFRGLVIAMVLVVALGACGDDGDTAPTGDQSTGESTPDDGGGIEASVSDGDLLVPREYLQGEWCDSDGENWIIEGDIARLDDGSGGTAEFPIDILFIDGADVDLISQTDEMFVFGSSVEEVTFTRGLC